MICCTSVSARWSDLDQLRQLAADERFRHIQVAVAVGGHAVGTAELSGCQPRHHELRRRTPPMHHREYPMQRLRQADYPTSGARILGAETR